MNEKKHKHMDYAQSIISRMASNSFLIKGWTITLVSAIIALSSKEASGMYIYASLIPVLIFWVLDGYFLFQERLYRSLYNEVRQKKEDDSIDYDLNATGFEGGNKTWGNSIFSKTLIIFYATLIILILAWIVIINNYNCSNP
ncbi:MAG: hypothetical protein K0Q79_3616 [Flavipsychrobacter sp.]|jgi:hypothetical protein|nr:hypothetical protein [Flavipsychrobacter sp.]